MTVYKEEPVDYEALPASSTLRDHMLAGAFAGIMEHIIMYPVDCVKTRMQCLRPAHHVHYSNVISGVYRLIRTEGIRGSLRGIGIMVGGAGPAHAAYFGCYEHIKKALENSQLKSTHLAPLAGGACATLLHDAVMTPADAVKQRLQMYNSPYHNSLDCLRRVCVTEGPRTLYRAYFTQLTMNVPYQSIHFVCYEAVQDFINPTRHYLPWTHMVAGAMAGCIAAASTNPLDVCKTALNTQERCFLSSSSTSGVKEPQIRGLFEAARFIFALEGARGFLRGAGARVLSAVPGTAISWSVYEYFKRYWKDKPPSSDSWSRSAGDTTVDKFLDFSITERSVVGRGNRLFSTSNEVTCACSTANTNSGVRSTRAGNCAYRE
ncbi:Mitochondrial iron transporter 1 [Paragonimus heterotremus]|uniref:Mitochondrial iron transporter 1 n=1 Tax=Paragonimus heterotremus TaxID=100268 RepID=A0A8J4WUU9_9TREM|nr:Mitochondrial iron transporter 1 [Paragonimus heterotremus]